MLPAVRQSPYQFILPEDRHSFELNLDSHYINLAKASIHLPDFLNEREAVPYYYFVDLCLRKEGIRSDDLSPQEYRNFANIFQHSEHLLPFAQDMTYFYAVHRHTTRNHPAKGGGFSCVQR